MADPKPSAWSFRQQFCSGSVRRPFGSCSVFVRFLFGTGSMARPIRVLLMTDETFQDILDSPNDTSALPSWPVPGEFIIMLLLAFGISPDSVSATRNI